MDSFWIASSSSALGKVLVLFVEVSVETLAVSFATEPTFEGFNSEVNYFDVSC